MIRLFSLVLVLILFGCAGHQSEKGQGQTKGNWINFDYDTVKAYYFDYKNQNNDAFLAVAKAQELSPNIYNPEGALLNSEQVLELGSILNGNQNESDEKIVNSCYVPRHGIVFYKEDSIVAHVSICFECNQVKTKPKGNKLDEANRLIPLFKDLKLPINRKNFPIIN